MKPMFSPEELEELRLADAEIDETFEMTREDYRRSRELDMAAGKRYYNPKKQHDYYLANREKILARNKAYRNRIMENGKTYAQNYKEKHRKELSAQARERHRKNPESKRQAARAYYYRNQERIKAQARERYHRRKAEKENQNERV